MTLREVAAIAARYDTQMARAFRQALRRRGVPVPGTAREAHRYRGLMACFRNATSPMDWPRGRARGGRR